MANVLFLSDQPRKKPAVEQGQHPAWDHFSDQPHRIAKSAKERASWASIKEHILTGSTAAIVAPAVLWRFLTLRPTVPPPDPKTFVGLSVSPQPMHNTELLEMVADLGVEELLVRIPTWALDQLDDHRRFLEQFRGKRLLINILQSRQSVLDLARWREALRRIFAACLESTVYFQIGNATNRCKWGCFHSGEQLRLLEAAEEVRAEFPEARLAGPSVIDFEILSAIRSLINGRRFQLDRMSAQLYVNRRGSPKTRQYLLFDLHRKIRLYAAIAATSKRCPPRLWITETNWPVLGTGSYLPNSGNPKRTVDEPTQARYLTEYYQIARASGFVEKVYWWQLIAPGYGLVDSRGGQLRKRPAYFAFKELLARGMTSLMLVLEFV